MTPVVNQMSLPITISYVSNRLKVLNTVSSISNMVRKVRPPVHASSSVIGYCWDIYCFHISSPSLSTKAR
jgi:hypothetical protein